MKNRIILAMLMASKDKEGLGVYQTLNSDDVFYKEVKCASEGNNLAQPLILLDPAMPVPHDLQYSFIKKMKQ